MIKSPKERIEELEKYEGKLLTPEREKELIRDLKLIINRETPRKSKTETTVIIEFENINHFPEKIKSYTIIDSIKVQPGRKFFLSKDEEKENLDYLKKLIREHEKND